MKTREKNLVVVVSFSFLFLLLMLFSLIAGCVNENNWPMLLIGLPFFLIVLKHGRRAINIAKNSLDEDIKIK